MRWGGGAQVGLVLCKGTCPEWLMPADNRSLELTPAAGATRPESKAELSYLLDVHLLTDEAG